MQAPWVAAIFLKLPDTSPPQWKFLCSGTITSYFTVMTSARCILPRILGPRLSLRPHHIRYADLQVVAGLPTTDYASKDEHTQFGTVGQIRDTFEWNSSGDTPDRDLAVIRLRNRLNTTTPYVKAVSLFETSGTLLEAKETRSGETLLLAGYENPDLNFGVKTRSQQDKGSPLKVHSVTITDVTTCIDRHTENYPTYYFNVLCATTPKKSSVIPCNYQGSGLVKKVKDAAGSESYYLFGVYSSNSALAKSEGTLVDKNQKTPPPCSSSDIIFVSRYSQLDRWALSSQFCDNDLAICKNDRCRPWEDLCNGQMDCEDGSDENEKMCFHQNRECGKDKFRCAYGACIDGQLACDSITDCKDGSDEDATFVCKGRSFNATGPSETCEGIKSQETVTAHCSHDQRPGLLPCQDRVPIGTKAVLRSKEIVVTCGRDGKWSRSTRLTC